MNIAGKSHFFFSRRGVVPRACRLGRRGGFIFFAPSATYIEIWEGEPFFFFASSVSSFCSTFLVLLHSARFVVFLPRHWLLRSLATTTMSVAPEVCTIFCLAIQFFWHQRHGVKRRCHSKRVSSSQVALPPHFFVLCVSFANPSQPPSSSA